MTAEVVQWAKEHLSNSQPVVLSFTADLTRYDVVITPLSSLLWTEFAKDHVMSGARPPGDFVLVSLPQFNACYQFKLLHAEKETPLHPAYVAEKFRLHPQGQDTQNLTELLNGIRSS